MAKKQTRKATATKKPAAVKKLSVQEQRNVALSVLDCIPMGILFADGRRRILMANATATEIGALKDGLRMNRQELHANIPREDEALGAALAEAGGGAKSKRQATSMLSITRPSGETPFGLLITPVSLPDGKGAKASSVVAVFVADPEQETVVPLAALRDLFGLTPAEGKLAALLATGRKIEDAASDLHVSVHTARAQLKQVFAKTRTHRQSALVRLLLTGPAPLRLDKAGRSLRRLGG